LFNLFNVVLRNIRNNNAILLANSMAVEQLEIVRGMEFNNIKTDTGWVPAGPILSEKHISKEGIGFTIKTDVSWVDDPFDEIDPVDIYPFDYKKVRVRVYWTNPVGGGLEEVAMSTNIVPEGLEGLSEGTGGIYLTVFDSQGIPVFEAEADISSDSMGYSLENAKTDVNGNLWIPELDPASDYHIQITKAGYSTTQTYAINNDPASVDYNPIPEKTDLFVIDQKISRVGFAIDVLGGMNINTVNFNNPANLRANADLNGEKSALSAAIDFSGNVFVAWVDNRNVENNIYIQKLSYNSGSDTYSVAWSGDTLIVDENGCSAPQLEMLDDGSLYLVWSDQRTGESDIYLSEINLVTGNLIGSEYKVDGGSIGSLQDNPTVDSDQDGNIYMAWEDNRDGDWDIYCQKFNTSSGNFWSSDLKINDSDYLEQLSPKIVLDRDSGAFGENENNFYVIWESDHSGNFDIFIKKYSNSGSVIFSDKVVNSDGGALDQYDAAIVFDGADYMYIVWTDDRNFQPDIYMQKLDKNGNGVWSSGDVKVNDDAFDEARRLSPSVAYGSDSSIYVSWEDSRNSGDAFYNIYAAKVNSVGEKAWGYDLVLADTLESYQMNSFTLLTPSGKAMSLWEDDRVDELNNIFSARYIEWINMASANIPITLTSTKGKGTYPNPDLGGIPEYLSIPKYAETFTSNSFGHITIGETEGGLEWGTYTFSAEAPYYIISIDLPSPISVNPGQSVDVVINIGY
ncbi:MAG: hypothetical protein PHI66_04500, partial [Candidatus Pacebacteria bacterium]|nr:hypothetical protein [Candidatus Paceibacterota bacterium]